MTGFDADFRDELWRLLRMRRDVRHFRTDPVDSDVIDDCLRSFSLAPSVGLSEPWRVVRVNDPARRIAARENFRAANADALAGYSGDDAKIYAGLKLSGMDDAPVQIAVFSEDNTTKGKGLGAGTMPEMKAYSCVSAIMQFWLLLRAHRIGLGWVSILDPEQLTRDLDVPSHWRLIGYFCIGYPLTEEESPELERLGWEKRQDLPALLER
ncbi:5,6-dimethylbenzimidazole synthase [Marivivens donghaensis]|uniref:5,6-dimethylbenzimidazole synthase n=1 Tax=Marivivens donghaensis TaxID=1699413 RepID=A0ABX0VWG1_9RHOB|nr:5,6-dimethylbenzimidazole synthase [Marivivens donghaensis]NIY70948.1 5,6-dimethylbenzimidazole synthase [Marivivens donghaensis]